MGGQIPQLSPHVTLGAGGYGAGNKSLVPLISISVRDIYRDHLSDAAHAHRGWEAECGAVRSLWRLPLPLPCARAPHPAATDARTRSGGRSAELRGRWGRRRAANTRYSLLRFPLVVAVWAFDIVTVEGEGCSASAEEGGRGEDKRGITRMTWILLR